MGIGDRWKNRKKQTKDEQNEQRRQFVLNGNVWWTVISICFPMALFQLINQLFRVVDLAVTAHIDAEAVAAVSFFSNISNAVVAVGTGYATAVGIIVAGAYGQGAYKKVKEVTNTSFAIGMGIAVLLSGVLIVFCPFVMQLANTPQTLIDIGTGYYYSEMVGAVVSFFNCIYIAIEKARGNGKRILYLNIGLAVIKISLAALFILVLGYGVVWVSISTVIANTVVMCYGILCLNGSDSVFGLDIHWVKCEKDTLKELVTISIPTISERLALNLGRVIVNAYSAEYDTTAIAALGVSNTISSLSVAPPSSVGDGASAIIRQNIGHKQPARAKAVFWCMFKINLILGIGATILSFLFITPLTNFFAGGDAAFAIAIVDVFQYELISNSFLALNSSAMGLFYATGYAKIAFVISFMRLFIFRIPVLIYLQNFTTIPGSQALGMVMMISNVLTGIFSFIAMLYVLKKSSFEEISITKKETA